MSDTAKTNGQSHKHTNRLIDETSPYLLQHAHNPVNWYAWGEEALQKASSEDKPILLSVGYSACHWCHVMERESFENEEIAAIMNQHFISIKVDREERPDIDAYGLKMPLQPDMLLKADVILEQRSLMKWLFDPVFSTRM